MSLDPAQLAAPGVRGIQPYQPGKPTSELERELGLTGTVKLASNESPLGPPESALAALRDAAGELARYPDGNAYALRRRLAASLDVAPEQITLGNGSNDVLVLLAEAFLQPGLSAVYSRYSFAVYALAVQATGATAHVADALPPDHPEQPLGHDLDALADALAADTRLVYIANPNNPTGTWVGPGALRAFVHRVPETTLVVVDEAYCEYLRGRDYASALPWLAECPNVVVTRTFSKAWGLAGLRVGYAVSSPEIADVLNRIRQPFNVNAAAQAAAEAVLDDADYLERALAINAEGMAALRATAADLGLRVGPDGGNFLLVDFGRDAAPIYQGLLEQGVIVRPVAGYGLPGYLRISIGTPAEMARLDTALRKVVGG